LPSAGEKCICQVENFLPERWFEKCQIENSCDVCFNWTMWKSLLPNRKRPVV
jgi:hypothetical protein